MLYPSQFGCRSHAARKLTVSVPRFKHENAVNFEGSEQCLLSGHIPSVKFWSCSNIKVLNHSSAELHWRDGGSKCTNRKLQHSNKLSSGLVSLTFHHISLDAKIYTIFFLVRLTWHLCVSLHKKLKLQTDWNLRYRAPSANKLFIPRGQSRLEDHWLNLGLVLPYQNQSQTPAVAHLGSTVLQLQCSCITQKIDHRNRPQKQTGLSSVMLAEVPISN